MTTIVDSNLPVARPSWDHSRLESRIVHLGCGAFHRAHQALYTHHLLESTDSDWGICEVNLMPGNDRVLIENLKKQQLLYTVAEKGAESTELKIIGSMKEALHPEIDGCEGILNAMARPQTAIVSLTVTEKGYCADAASGQLDLNNPLIKHDLENPTAPKSAIGYIVEALRLRREKGLKAFTVMSCDNVRENGHVAKVAVLGLAQARDPQLAAWIEENVTFPCTMVDRIVPAATPETLQEIADQLGVYDPCAIACEPFRQWVIEDNFVNGRPDWDKVGAQFVADVVPFEMMKLRMLNGSHSFLAYLGYLGGYETIADTVTNPAYRQRWRLFLHHQGKGRFAIIRVSHGVGNSFIAAEVTEICQERVAAVQHTQLHHFERYNIRNKLRADFIPVRTTINEVIFNYPLTERFAGNGARVVNTQLVSNFL